MQRPVYFVQADTKTQLQAVLTRETSGSAVDLTLADTVNLYVRRRHDDTVLFTVEGVINNSEGGQVIFSFTGGEFDIAAGEYQAELEVIYLDNTRETVFEVLDIIIREDYA